MWAAQLFHRAAGHEQHAHDIAVGADGKILHQMVALGAHGVFETGIGGDVQLAPGHHVVEDGGRPGDDLEIVGDDARFQGMIDGQDVEVADTAHAQGISGQTGFTGHGIPPGRRSGRFLVGCPGAAGREAPVRTHPGMLHNRPPPKRKGREQAF